MRTGKNKLRHCVIFLCNSYNEHNIAIHPKMPGPVRPSKRAAMTADKAFIHFCFISGGIEAVIFCCCFLGIHLSLSTEMPCH